MSIFSSIMEKLGLQKPAAPAQAPSTPAPSGPVPSAAPQARSPYENLPREGMGSTAHPAPMAMVDVVSKLEAMAAKKGEQSNWKVSIADLLYLLGIDNSLKARQELAVELGCPADVMADNIKMNTWLHKTVLAKIAENGGNIPPELLK